MKSEIRPALRLPLLAAGFIALGLGVGAGLAEAHAGDDVAHDVMGHVTGPRLDGCTLGIEHAREVRDVDAHRVLHHQ